MPVSIFNDIIGPIMRGPSSGHTAATWRMGNMTLQLLGVKPDEVDCRFHKTGAYANVYKQQRSDLAFTAGLMNFSMRDKKYDLAFSEAKASNINLLFTTPSLAGADHPNEVEVYAKANTNNEITVRYRSIGGGIASFISIDGHKVHYTGNKYALFICLEQSKSVYAQSLKQNLLQNASEKNIIIEESLHNETLLYSFYSSSPFSSNELETLILDKEIKWVRSINPLMFPIYSADATLEADFFQQIVAYPPQNISSASELAQKYEKALLGISEEEAKNYFTDCIEVMENCVKFGLNLTDKNSMRLLKPLAHSINQQKDNMLIGGIHGQIAVYAMAAAEWNASGGLIVAAPTAGSGAILPATIAGLKELGFSDDSIAKGLWAAGLIGFVIAHEYTFAGGVGGCQVEIGSAGAMAAAMIVEATLHERKLISKEQTGFATVLSAATLFLQNSLGLVCDPVQGFVELPCIARNATASSQAFVCADLALAGWQSPISFHDSILAMKDVGDKMSMELRCTSLGGLASRPLAKGNTVSVE